MNLEAGRFFAKVKIVAARCGAALLELLKLAGSRKGRRPFLFSDKNETNTRVEPSYTKVDGLWSKARVPANWSAKSEQASRIIPRISDPTTFGEIASSR